MSQRIAFQSIKSESITVEAAIRALNDYYNVHGFSALNTKKHINSARFLMRSYGTQINDEIADQIRLDMTKAGKKASYIFTVMYTLEHIAASQHIMAPDGSPLKFEKPKVRGHRIDYLTADEARALLSAAQNVRDLSMLYVMLYGALRLKEITNANVGDYIHAKRLFWVKDNRDDDIPYPGIKNGKEAAVALTKDADKILMEYLKSRPNVESRAMFISTLGRRISARQVEKIVYTTAKRAGIKRPVHPHLLRHTCITHMVKSNVNLALVNKQARHSSISMTMRYTHPDDEMLRDAIDKAVMF